MNEYPASYAPPDAPPLELRPPEPRPPERQLPESRSATWLAAVLVLVLVFAVGVLVGQSGALGGGPVGAVSTGANPTGANPTGSGALPTPAGSGIAVDCKEGAPTDARLSLPSGAPADFNLFWQALACIHQNFVGRGEVDQTELTYGAIRGLVDALGDTGHSTFLTPEALASEQQALDGTVVGIGALLGEKEGQPVIVSVISGGPASRAGIRAGDAIVSVNGESVSGQAPDEVASQIRGTEGTEVVVQVFRPATNETIDFTMIREKIDFPAASWAFVPGTKIADLRLIQFSNGASDELRTVRDQAIAEGATGFILDLRSNPGGYVHEAVRTASLFLDKKTVYIRELASGERITVPTDDNYPASDLPMVVLIDQGTASSAEIVAAGLDSAGRGELIGQTTFGTGTVLLTYNLADGSAVRIAVERWLTPDGALIFGQGITPTVELEMPATGRALEPQELAAIPVANLPTMEDAQLIKAIELVTAAGAR